MREITELRLKLLHNGYVPLPLEGKKPLFNGWQNIQPDEKMIRGWECEYPNLCNTGIRATECPVIDIDILDPEGVRIVLGAISPGQRLLYRTGRAPKVAMLFRASEPFQKMAHVYRAPNGETHKIEILCNGQQMAAFGIHPDTRQPFAWRPEDPTTVCRDELPELTEEMARRFLATCDRRLEANRWEALTVERPRISEWRKPLTENNVNRNVEGLINTVLNAREGTRNDILFWAACRLANLVENRAITRRNAYGMAVDAGTRAGLPPHEAMRTVQSAFSGDR
jgi:Bifunctional DNA primase/polymerase, N-terminal